MKKILALVLASVMMVSSTICAFAAEETPQGSTSPTAEIIKMREEIEKLNEQVAELTKAVKARQTIVINNGGGGGGSSSGGGGGRPTAPANSNYVSYGGTITYQGGKIEINGGKSNVTFTITAPGGGVMTSANNLAGKVGGSLITCINTSSPGVAFSTAKVNFFVSGVQAGENIAVYQDQNGSWVQLPVVEVRKDHVVVNMSRHGNLAFVRVPAMASIG